MMNRASPALPHDDADLEGWSLPAWTYSDPEYFQVEMARIMRPSWQVVCHANDIPNAGDWYTLDFLGESILVVRGDDGEVRAFANVCRHRAGPLALCNGRGARALTCKYHGWTYTLEGQLRSAPEMQGAKDFDVAGIRLPALRVAQWQGLVFVCADDAAPGFDEVYGGIAERIAPIDLAALRFARRDHYDIACDWKVYVDNFLEGYHLPHVHPGLSKVLDYRAYDTELLSWKSLQHSPLRDAGGTSAYGEGQAFYWFVYPNVMLNILPGRLQTNRVLPLGPGRCRVEFDYFYAPGPAGEALAAADRGFSDEVQAEDIAICEAVQRGLESGSYDAGRLCPKRESALWHFHQQLRAAYAADEAA